MFLLSHTHEEGRSAARFELLKKAAVTVCKACERASGFAGQDLIEEWVTTRLLLPQDIPLFAHVLSHVAFCLAHAFDKAVLAFHVRKHMRKK